MHEIGDAIQFDIDNRGEGNWLAGIVRGHHLNSDGIFYFGVQAVDKCYYIGPPYTNMRACQCISVC